MKYIHLKHLLARFFTSQDGWYAAATLMIALVSCIGTWVAPQILSSIRGSDLVSANSASALAEGKGQLISLLGTTTWILFVAFGSTLLWFLVVRLISFVGRVFELTNWKEFLSNSYLLRFMIIVFSIYLYLGVFFRSIEPETIPHAPVVLAAQAAGMVLCCGFAVILGVLARLFMDTIIYAGVKQMSVEAPEELARIERDLDDMKQELHNSFTNLTLRLLIGGLLLGAILGIASVISISP